METKRINVTLPAEVADDLERYVPPRKRNRVIVEATAAYLRRLKLLAALRETAGAWDDASHPELATAEDIDRWLAEIRSNWQLESSGEQDTDG